LNRPVEPDNALIEAQFGRSKYATSFDEQRVVRLKPCGPGPFSARRRYQSLV